MGRLGIAWRISCLTAAAVLLSIAAPGHAGPAQRANCSTIAFLADTEAGLLEAARQDLRDIVTGYAHIVAQGAPRTIAPLTPEMSRALAAANARVNRHAGNVQRLVSYHNEHCRNRTPATTAARPVPPAPRVGSGPPAARSIAVARPPRIYGYPAVSPAPVRRTSAVNRTIHRTSRPQRVTTAAAPRRHVARPGIIRDPPRR